MLIAEADEVEDYHEKLVRLQYAIFGINPNLSLELLQDEETIDVNFVKDSRTLPI